MSIESKVAAYATKNPVRVVDLTFVFTQASLTALIAAFAFGNFVLGGVFVFLTAVGVTLLAATLRGYLKQIEDLQKVIETGDISSYFTNLLPPGTQVDITEVTDFANELFGKLQEPKDAARTE